MGFGAPGLPCSPDLPAAADADDRPDFTIDTFHRGHHQPADARLSEREEGAGDDVGGQVPVSVPECADRVVAAGADEAGGVNMHIADVIKGNDEVDRAPGPDLSEA